MTKPQILSAILTLAATYMSQAEDPDISERLKALTANYEAAVDRAIAPLTKTYLNELNKMKLEYTRAGDLQSALQVESLIKKYTAEAPLTPISTEKPLPQVLSRMSIEQFKTWLTTVEIVQGDGLVIDYDGTTISVTDGKTLRRSQYSAATVEIGKVTIPYTKGASIVEIDNRLEAATVFYPTVNAEFDATIRLKKDK
jgi:hypothetical protein